MVKPRMAILMYIKGHPMCSSNYKRNLGFEFTKRPPYQLGWLEEIRVSTWEGGMRNKTKNDGSHLLTA